MALQFAALASGSSGNAALVRGSGAGLLIDLGLGVRDLTERLAAVGANWEGVTAALLTHTHGDHVSESSLAALARCRVPLFCHEGHRPRLAGFSAFANLEANDLVRTFDDRPFLVPGGFQVESIPLSHDGGPTFGFRVQGRDARRARPSSIGYLADTGCWNRAMVDGLVDVDLLGIEFNHDVLLTHRSGRPRQLVERNLGDGGHLSNDQGAGLLAEILRQSSKHAVRHVVLLHLSRQCNRPDLAHDAASQALRCASHRSGIQVASQTQSMPPLDVAPARRARRPASSAGFPWEGGASTSAAPLP